MGILREFEGNPKGILKEVKRILNYTGILRELEGNPDGIQREF